MTNTSPSNDIAGYSRLFEAQDVPSKPVSHPFLDEQFQDDDDNGSSNQDMSMFSAGGEVLQISNRVDMSSTKTTKADENVETDEEPACENSENWEEDSDEIEYEDDYEFWDERNGPNSQAVREMQKNFHTSDELFRKFSSRINVEKFEGVEHFPAGVGNKILSTSKRAMSQGMKVKDKQDRATVEQVLDPKTRMIVYKLLSSGKMVSIDGCISTGKEANVYHATGPDNTALAIKIYKTSILTFKARDKYVSGEFRFRQGYCKKNPRKMVRLWAEKEFRNLLRIHTCGLIKVPHPKILKSHVLVMEFIGENGWPCPLLKDVKFNDLDVDDVNLEDMSLTNSLYQDPVSCLLANLYRQCLLILYRLFKHCKLVHADFSEFNLILKDYKELYVIDVSQSVEHDHPRSFDFLRHDIKNVQDFFGKHILVGDYKDIFEFITSPNVDDSNYEVILDNILEKSKKLESFNVSEEVFRQTHIPRKMQEVVDYERDYEKLQKGETELVYTRVMGMKPDMSGPETAVLCPNKDSLSLKLDDPAVEIKNVCFLDEKENVVSNVSTKDSSESESESSSEGEDTEGDNDEQASKLTSSRPKHETQEEKRQRKKQVKDDKAEKRKTKVKKHVKKRREKLAHANSKK